MIARENIRINEEELERELAKKMFNPNYIIDEILKKCFKITLESHNINHVNSILSIIPIYPDFGIEVRYINKILKEMATFYARLLNKEKFKYQILFSCIF